MKTKTAKKPRAPRVPKPVVLPNRLRELRVRGLKDLTLEMVGKLCDLDTATVSRHESGERSLSREQVAMYAALYRVPSAELFIAPEQLAPSELPDPEEQTLNAVKALLAKYDKGPMASHRFIGELRKLLV